MRKRLGNETEEMKQKRLESTREHNYEGAIKER